MQLLCQKWPAEIAAKYARAYARHGEWSCQLPRFTYPVSKCYPPLIVYLYD